MPSVGNKYLLLESLADHRKDDSALGVEDQKVVVKGKDTIRKSTADWGISYKRKDGSTLWEVLSNLKE